MKLLSFIIPSYNSERFLNKCIDSMISEDVSEKIEIIVVNDGSLDSTKEIAESYCLKYPQIVKLVSQENRGHGGAINSGIKVATGKYLKVIDADDWIETENLPTFLEWLSNIESDVVITHYYTYDISTNEKKKIMSYMPEFGRAYSLGEILNMWNDFDRTVTFHGITYNTNFYLSHFKSLTEHVFFEDHEFSTFPCCYAQSITPLDLFIYCYRIGDVSQSVSDINQLKRVSHYETIINGIINEFSGISDGLSDDAKNFICVKTKIILMSYFTVLLLIETDKKKGRAEAKKVISNLSESMPTAYLMIKKKYRFMLLMNKFGIKKKTMDKFLSSKLYRIAKGAHDLD